MRMKLFVFSSFERFAIIFLGYLTGIIGGNVVDTDKRVVGWKDTLKDHIYQNHRDQEIVRHILVFADIGRSEHLSLPQLK